MVRNFLTSYVTVRFSRKTALWKYFSIVTISELQCYGCSAWRQNPEDHDLNTRGYNQIFRTESITTSTTIIINNRWEAIQRVMAAKLTRLTQKIAIQLHIVARNCSICSSRCRRPVRKLLNIPSKSRRESLRILNSKCVFCHILYILLFLAVHYTLYVR
jgi:hypothetical protein